MNFILSVAILLLSTQVFAQANNRSLGLSKMYFEVDRYTGTQYEPYLDFESYDDEEELFGRIALVHEYVFFKTTNFNIFWDNMFHTKTTEKQFRYAGWKFSLGMSFYSLEMFFSHHSQHILESIRDKHFPVDNHVGIRWYMVK